MERPSFTRPWPWSEVEVLQWMERNTQLFVSEDSYETYPLNSNRASQNRIEEILS